MKNQLYVGLLANQASVDAQFTHTAQKLPKMGYTLKALFAPQHGYAGHTQANMIEVDHGVDKARRVPVYSLYGEVRKPTAAMLDGLDAVIIDLQDVGARGYTFVWTVLYMMEACADADVTILMIDRPNPISGAVVEGPLLEEEFVSFVGLHPIPIRHGLTIGELAMMMRAERGIEVDLHGQQVNGWHRAMYFQDTGLPWVMPSPNVPTPVTTILYPGMELFEGTNLSEGRGTTRPFEFFGAPFIDAPELAAELNHLKLPGIFFRAASFQPTFDKWKGELCHGAQIHITQHLQVRPVETAVAILRTVIKNYRRDFKFLPPPYEYEKKKMPFDILAGTGDLRAQLLAQESLKKISRGWQAGCKEFLKRCKPHLLYPGKMRVAN